MDNTFNDDFRTNLTEIFEALEEIFGEDIGITIYKDLSGHVFRCDDEDYYMEFEDITTLTISDIEDYGMKNYPFGMCKHCGYEFDSELINEYNIEYCPFCGKKIGE